MSDCILCWLVCIMAKISLPDHITVRFTISSLPQISFYLSLVKYTVLCTLQYTCHMLHSLKLALSQNHRSVRQISNSFYSSPFKCDSLCIASILLGHCSSLGSHLLVTCMHMHIGSTQFNVYPQVWCMLFGQVHIWKRQHQHLPPPWG